MMGRNSSVEQPSQSSLNKSSILQVDQLNRISEDVGRENIEFQRFQMRLHKAQQKQSKIFDSHFNKYVVPQQQKEIDLESHEEQ